MIKFDNVNKYYTTGDEKFHALSNINLEIEKGEFLAIMGPSGSGKSTMIKILGLLDNDFEGIYSLLGRDIKKFSDDELSKFRNEKVGFVFQDFNLIKRLTVKENIELPMLYNGKKIKDTKSVVQALLKKVQIENKIDKYPNELSGGQQQRVSIARALVNSPEIIIADEPTGALDSHTSKEIMRIFKELNDDGITIILITHDINVAKQAKRMARIFDGEISEGED